MSLFDQVSLLGRLRLSGFILFDYILLSQKCGVEVNRRMQSGGQAFTVAEYLLVMSPLRRTVNTGGTEQRSGVRNHGLNGKTAKTALKTALIGLSHFLASTCTSIWGGWCRPAIPAAERRTRIPALPYPPLR
jgi:hypothetical protein